MPKVYAAKFTDGSVGRYSTWDECSKNTKGVPGVLFKSFNSDREREEWLNLKTAVHVDDGKGLRVYIDGSYSRIKGRASWAFAVVNGDTLVYDDSGIVPDRAESNNIDGECYAAMNAIMWLQGEGIKAKIVHDYIGISAWLTGEHQATSKIARKYVTLCSAYAKDIEFVKVKGHTGNEWNEYVDKLAKKANEIT